MKDPRKARENESRNIAWNKDHKATETTSVCLRGTRSDCAHTGHPTYLYDGDILFIRDNLGYQGDKSIQPYTRDLTNISQKQLRRAWAREQLEQ